MRNQRQGLAHYPATGSHRGFDAGNNMADEENQSTIAAVMAEAVTVAPVQPITPPVDKQFTQEDMNRLAAKAREEGRRSAAKEREQQQVKPPETKVDDGEKLTLKELKAQLDETKRRADFEKKIRKYTLADEDADDFYDLYKMQNPSEPDWFDKKAKLFVKQPTVQPASPPPATATATAAADAPKPPPLAPSAPSGHGLPTQDGIVDIFSMSEDQRRAMTPMGIRKSLEAMVAIGNSQAGIPQRPKPPSQR